MADFRFQRRIERGEFEDDGTPLERLLAFYRANGYVVDDTDVAAAGETLRVERGEEGAGWWTSDMTKLPARVELRAGDETVEIRYVVDTSGQIMTDADRAFWRREADAAGAYLRGESRRARDLRADETERAEGIHADMLTRGIWGAIIVFVMITFLRLLGMF